MQNVIGINEQGCYFLTLEVAGQLDLFIRPVYRQIIVHSLNHFIDAKGLIVYGWCLLSNRLHLICQAQVNMALGSIRREFKNFTTAKMLDAIQMEPEERRTWMMYALEQNRYAGNCWKPVQNPVSIDMRYPQNMAETLDYIHSLPVKERIVQYAGDYIYSSAKDYENTAGLVKVTRLSVVSHALDNIHNTKSGFKKFIKK